MNKNIDDNDIDIELDFDFTPIGLHRFSEHALGSSH